MRRRETRRGNPIARALSHARLRLRVVSAKKGKTAYKRRPKHTGRRFVFSPSASVSR